MGRYISLIFALIFIGLSSSFAQNDRNEKERNWVKTNKIASKEQWDYRYVNGEPSRKGFLSSKMIFDKEGRVTEITNFLKDGQVVNVSSYSFDPRGNQKEYIKYTGNKAKLSFRQTFTYDAHGNKTAETGFNGIEEYLNNYTYNQAGKLSEIKYYIAGELDETRQFRYKADEVEVLVTDSQGVLKFRIKNKVDAKDNILEMTKMDKSGVELERTIYSYSEESLLVKEENYSKETLNERLVYKYDAGDNLLEIWVEKADGAKYLKNSYTYRPDGRISEEKWRSSPTADFSNKKYTYDNKGQLKTTDSYFASYKYRVLSKYNYK